MKSLMTARCACGPADGGSTPKRTPSSWPVGSTYVRCTKTCGVWAYKSKKRGRSSTSVLKSIPTNVGPTVCNGEIKPLLVAMGLFSCQRANSLPTGNIMNKM